MNVIGFREHLPYVGQTDESNVWRGEHCQRKRAAAIGGRPASRTVPVARLHEDFRGTSSRVCWSNIHPEHLASWVRVHSKQA